MELSQTERIVLVIICLVSLALMYFISTNIYNKGNVGFSSDRLAYCKEGQALINNRNVPELRKRFPDAIMFKFGLFF